MNNSRALALLALSTLLHDAIAQGPIPQNSADLASSYVEAQEFGRRDEKDPATLEYHRSVLLPAFSASYRANLRDCQASLPQPDPSPFSFVAAIDSQGNVLRLWSDRTPVVYSCLRGKMLFERFPPPPHAPFYLYIHMRYAN
ncbi:MAG: hypothetical protein H7X75_07665 [Burkholderiaceae bacterium]|nr:hypothetical protein [Burkholderiaceae bacterium]